MVGQVADRGRAADLAADLFLVVGLKQQFAYTSAEEVRKAKRSYKPGTPDIVESKQIEQASCRTSFEIDLLCPLKPKRNDHGGQPFPQNLSPFLAGLGDA